VRDRFSWRSLGRFFPHNRLPALLTTPFPQVDTESNVIVIGIETIVDVRFGSLGGRNQFRSKIPNVRWWRTNEISSATAFDERKQTDHEIIILALDVAGRETYNRALLCFRFVRFNSDLDASRDFMQPLGNLSDNDLVLRKDCDRR
jgi:hypothetical protein